jgi:hypothetical protein
LEGTTGDKEIILFTFGLGPDRENDLPINGTIDYTGKIPISVILSGDNLPSLRQLRPEIEYIGESLSPGSGTARDFSSSVASPVVYTVTAKDKSTQNYGVQVYLQNESSKEIVRFSVDIGGGRTAEGSIDQNAMTVSVSVPSDAVLGNLTAHIVHTGQTVRDPAGRVYRGNTFDMVGDFSVPGVWTVIAHDGGEKTYTVTVEREKSDVREITSFSFHITGEEDIIGGEPQPDGKYPILVVLPEVAYNGMKTLPKLPFINYRGESLSPTEEASVEFTNPLNPPTYTVAAENGSTRDYAVKVIYRDLPGDEEAEITGFYFTNPLVEGIIDQNAKTIVLTVPGGTDLRNLRPEVYYRGASVFPKSGQPKDFSDSENAPVNYTVRSRDGDPDHSKTYRVFVYTHPERPAVDTGTEPAKVSIGPESGGNYTVIVEFPTYIENPVVNINYPGSSQTINIGNLNFIDNVYYINNDETVLIINSPPEPQPHLSSAASIDCFYFTDPAAIGAIDNTKSGSAADPIPITVGVPYGTSLQNLEASIVFTGRRIEGNPGASPLRDGRRSFEGPVDYVVVADNDTAENPNRKYYRVSVNRGAPANAADITAFSFSKVPPVKVLISGVPNESGDYPIDITVPLGTNIAVLTPVITYTGVSITHSVWTDNTGPGTVTETQLVDFTNSEPFPVRYTVTAQDGTTPKRYAVTVREEEPDNIEITGFYFNTPLAVGKINQGANTITVVVSSGTNLGNLTPTVYFTGMTLDPGSGKANNFTDPAMYTVTGKSGKTRTYTVVVNLTPSGSKDITQYKLSGVANSNLIIGAVPGPDGSYPISVQVPAGTNLGSLVAEISHTGVSISPDGGSPRNFNSPQDYTVTAEDGSTKRYRVTVQAADSNAKMITSLIFETVPFDKGGTIRVLAGIDQTSREIRAEVPPGTVISALQPTVTYIGKSITPPSGGSSTANPFTDAKRNFSVSQAYTVEDQNGGTVRYNVIVTEQKGFTVTFVGEQEQDFIDNEFNPGTGILTVTVVDPNTVAGPYDWYIDGVKQGGSGADFSVNVGDGSFYPGRYELMVSGTKDGLRYTGKVYFVVSGGA